MHSDILVAFDRPFWPAIDDAVEADAADSWHYGKTKLQC